MSTKHFLKLNRWSLDLATFAGQKFYWNVNRRKSRENVGQVRCVPNTLMELPSLIRNDLDRHLNKCSGILVKDVTLDE